MLTLISLLFSGALLQLEAPADACFSVISEKTTHVVNVPGRETLRAVDGDMIKVSISHPVVPGYLGGVEARSTDEDVLRLVGIVPRYYPGGRGPDGSATSEAVFEVVGKGSATIKLQVGKRGNRWNRDPIKVSQAVEARIAPRTRGCR